ncbi:hypothetical protein [Acidaminococcus timonensis]|jgi:hypothetical protein|uniref:hypothetical protein n=2 Tax=Acidaminococcaceae TaxID=909930 RepID=UPI003A5BE718
MTKATARKERPLMNDMEQLAWDMAIDWEEKGYKDRESYAADLYQLIEEEQQRYEHMEAQEEY